MKFEVKTQNDDHIHSYFSAFLVLVLLSFLVVISSISLKIGSISTYYEIRYLCKLLVVDKSSANFKKLSKLTNQTTKQKMWELCKEIVK